MRRALRLHPDSRCAAATGIDVEVARSGAGVLTLHYVVTGQTRDLQLPQATAPARTDELWRHTCFEAFIRAGSAAYCEFNVAPSTQWAAYKFDSPRSGMRDAGEVETPRIAVRSSDTQFDLEVSLALGRLADLLGDAPWQVGLSAVIEETSGRKSYWALAHPPGRADFHHPDCFALELPAA